MFLQCAPTSPLAGHRPRNSGDTASFVETPATTILHGILLFLPGLGCFLKPCVVDPDVWWHLKAGEWIIAHGTCPMSDPFSWAGAGRPWTAYSWLPEMVLYGLYQALGLRGVVLFSATLSVAIMAALYAMLRRLGVNAPGLLALLGLCGMIPLLTPRPWLVSILLAIVEIDLLLTAGSTGNRRLLLWLAPLFCLWANSHIQFVLGLAILAAAVAESLLARLLPLSGLDDRWRPISFGWMLLVWLLSAAATLITPYHYHLYDAAAQLVGQLPKLGGLIEELNSMPFRSWPDWVALAVALGAGVALGRRPRVRPLLPMLLAASIYLGFRSQRDAWLILVVGLATVAYVASKRPAQRPAPGVRRRFAVALVVAVLLASGTAWLDEARLQDAVARKFPARAVRFLRQARRAGPLFNTFDWGGYVLWSLPELPVSMDGRTMVHGEDRILDHAATLAGRAPWREDPELAAARLVLLPNGSPLASILAMDRQFGLIYKDPVAVIFSRTDSQHDSPTETKHP